MTIQELQASVMESLKKYRIIGARLGNRPSDDEVVIENLEQKTFFVINVAGLADVTWGDVKGVLDGVRYPNVLTWVSRIVGYYSQVKNHAGWGWNRSKIAELHDRHKGNYGVEEVPGMGAALVKFSTSMAKPLSPDEWRERLARKGIQYVA